MAADFSIKAIIKAVDEFTAPVRGIIGTAEQFGKTATRVGRTMSTFVTAPLAALGFLSVATFANFEAGMASVSTLIDTTVESMAAMSDEVIKISTRTPVALGDLTSALFDIRSAGINAADAMGVLEGASRLGIAGLGSTKEAADLVTSAINAFNIEGEEQARLYDVIFKATKNGKTTISQLAQGFGAVAGTVANAGVAIDEYLASVAAMTTTGLPAAQAHTQIRAALAGLTRETEMSSAVFRRLGVKTFKELVASSGGMVPAFEKISNVLGGNDAAIIKLLGSVEAYNAMLALTRGQNEAFRDTLSDMRDGARAVDTAFEKQSATFSASMQIMRNQLGAVQNVIGAALAPTIIQAAGLIGEWAQKFTELSPGVQKTIVLVGSLVAGIGPLLVGLGLIATAVAAITLPVLLISAGVVALGAGLAALVIYWDEVTAALKPFGDAIAWVYNLILPLVDAVIWLLKNLSIISLAGKAAAVAGFVFGSGSSDGATAGVTPDTSPGVAGRTAAAQQAGAGGARDVNANMNIRFDNAPPGMRVERMQSDSPNVGLDADVGYNLVGVN